MWRSSHLFPKIVPGHCDTVFVQYMWMLFTETISGSAKVNDEICLILGASFEKRNWMYVSVPGGMLWHWAKQGGGRCQVLHAALLLQLSLKTSLIWFDRHFPSILVCSSKHEISTKWEIVSFCPFIAHCTCDMSGEERNFYRFHPALLNQRQMYFLILVPHKITSPSVVFGDGFLQI